VIQTPPPPYVAVVDSTAIPAGGGVVAPSASRKPIRPHECIFCGRRFTRKGKVWDCAERHLKRRTTEIVPCPYPECSFVSENEERFKNHIWTVHKTALRPKITIRTGAARSRNPLVRRRAQGQNHHQNNPELPMEGEESVLAGIHRRDINAKAICASTSYSLFVA
jgi:hypothetical protein